MHQVFALLYIVLLTKSIQNGKNMTPSIYGRYPKNIEKHSGKFKAEDWANFLLHYSLPLFKDNINHDVFEMWNQLAVGVTIAIKMEVNMSDIINAETAFATFLYSYYKRVYQHRRDQLVACTYTVHTLSYVAQCMR